MSFNKVKIIKLVLTGIILSSELFAFDRQNILEFLWNQAVRNNLNVNEANLKCYLNDKELELYWKKFLPKTSIYSSSSYDFDGDKLIIPEEVYVSAGITEALPGNGSLKFTPVLTLSKNLLDYRKDESFSNIEMIDGIKLNVELSQSLNPFWINRENINPEKKMLQLESKAAEIYKEIEVQNCLETVTEYFILLRQSERERLVLSSMIEYLEEKRESFYENTGRQNSKELDLFSVEEELSSYRKELNTCEKELWMTLKNICEVTGMREAEILLFEDENLLFCELPSIEKLYEENPKELYMKLQKQIVETEYVYNKQTSAPKLMLGSTVPVHFGESKSSSDSFVSGNNRIWSFSVTLDFSELLDGKKRKIEEKYKKYSEFYEKKQIEEVKNAENRYLIYEKILGECKKELEKAMRVLVNKQKTCDAYNVMFELGECNLLDLRLMEIYLRMTAFDVENIKDSIWLNEWMMING